MADMEEIERMLQLIGEKLTGMDGKLERIGGGKVGKYDAKNPGGKKGYK